MFKKNVMITVLAMLVVCLASGLAFGTVTTFSAGGLVGWTYVTGGYSLASPFTTVGPTANYWAATTPVVTNDWGISGGSWGWDAAQIVATEQVFALDGMYVGYHYQAPVGQVITGVNILEAYINMGTNNMVLQITDGAGVVKAQHVRTSSGDLVKNLSVTGLNASAIDIRFANIGTGMWATPAWTGNGVILNSVEVTTAIPEPMTISVLGLGVLGLLRRKLA